MLNYLFNRKCSRFIFYILVFPCFLALVTLGCRKLYLWMWKTKLAHHVNSQKLIVSDLSTTVHLWVFFLKFNFLCELPYVSSTLIFSEIYQQKNGEWVVFAFEVDVLKSVCGVQKWEKRWSRLFLQCVLRLNQDWLQEDEEVKDKVLV